MKTFVWGMVVVSAVLLGGCGSKGTSQGADGAAAPAAAEPAPAPKPEISCRPLKTKTEAARPATPGKPATATSKPAAKPAAKTATKTKAGSKPAPETPPATSATPSGPVSPNADGSCPAGYEAVVIQPAPAPAAKAAPEPAGKDAGPRMVKSKDGSFEGEVFGHPAPGSKLAKIQIGMTQGEVEATIGRPNDYRSYVTGKAFNPFYFGSDAARVEWIYRGYGSVAFDAGRWGGGGVVMMINHDPKIQ